MTSNVDHKKIILITIAVTFLFSTVLSLALSFYYTKFGYSNSVTKVTKNPDLSLSTITVTPTPTPFETSISLPLKYQIPGGTHAFQTFNNCGPASLSMALSFYDIFVSQKELGDELRPWQNPQGINDDKSVTLPELAKKATDFGLVAFYRPGGDIDLLKKFIVNNLPVITRTLTKTGEDIGHYRVVYGYDDSVNQIVQNDSLQGKALTFSYKNFMGLWKPYGYEYLVLVSPDKQKVVETMLGVNKNETTAWRNAVVNLEKDLIANPNDTFIKFSLSVAYYNIGEYQKSINFFEEVEPDLPFRTLWYQIEPLLAYQKLKKYDELLPRIEKIFTNGNRAFSELYQIRGEVYLDQGKVGEANAEFEKAILYNHNFSPEILK